MKIYTIQGQVRRSSQKIGFRLPTSPLSAKIPKSSVLNNLFNWIDQNNSFYFQILGIGILTLGMLLAFQIFPESGSASAYAEDVATQAGEVRLFQIYDNQNSNSSILEEVAVEPIFELDGDVLENGLVVSPEQKTYIVKRGDTLYAVARSLKINSEDLKELNGLEYPYSLSIGQELIYFVR